MDHYLDIRVLPDPELTEDMLMSALFAKLHRALGARRKGDVGVSFPEHRYRPGVRLRLHGLRPALEALEASDWRAGLDDYCRCEPIAPVPAIKGWRTVSRVQMKSSPERMLRRSVRKGWLTEAAARRQLTGMERQRSALSWINMKSLSTRQSFRLFIRHGSLVNTPVSGTFSSYGLSVQAT